MKDHAPGSVSLRIILKASIKEPGQPCEKIRGMALGSEERSCTKCSCTKASHSPLHALYAKRPQTGCVTTSCAVPVVHLGRNDTVQAHTTDQQREGSSWSCNSRPYRRSGSSEVTHVGRQTLLRFVMSRAEGQPTAMPLTSMS